MTARFRLLLSLALLLFLISCSNDKYGEPIDIVRHNVRSVTIEYRVVDTEHWWGGLATYRPLGRKCVVYIQQKMFNMTHEDLVWLVAHEVGHCLDYYELDYSHGGVGSSGCRFGTYYCPETEGFAAWYAFLYIDTCGMTLAPLGIALGQTSDCEAPDPRAVKSFSQNSYFHW